MSYFEPVYWDPINLAPLDGGPLWVRDCETCEGYWASWSHALQTWAVAGSPGYTCSPQMFAIKPGGSPIGR